MIKESDMPKKETKDERRKELNFNTFVHANREMLEHLRENPKKLKICKQIFKLNNKAKKIG